MKISMFILSLFTLSMVGCSSQPKQVYVPYDYQGALSALERQNSNVPTAQDPEPAPWDNERPAWEARQAAKTPVTGNFQQINSAIATDQNSRYGVTSHTCTSTPIYSMYGYVIRMDVRCH